MFVHAGVGEGSDSRMSSGMFDTGKVGQMPFAGVMQVTLPEY